MTGDRVYPDGRVDRFEGPPREFTDGEGRTVELRAVDESDLEAVVEMYVAFDPEDRAQGIPPHGEERIRTWVRDLLEDGINVAAVHDDRVVGHATLVPDAGEAGAHELAIFVLGEFQGAGVGTRLLCTLLGAGQAAGVERVWLTVEPWNRAAIHLYEKVGFEPCGQGAFEREFSIRLG